MFIDKVVIMIKLSLLTTNSSSHYITRSATGTSCGTCGEGLDINIHVYRVCVQRYNVSSLHRNVILEGRQWDGACKKMCCRTWMCGSCEGWSCMHGHMSLIYMLAQTQVSQCHPITCPKPSFWGRVPQKAEFGIIP